MRSVIKKILQILDGTPAVYGHHARGQSVVELALVSPILIVLIMGMVEIGWFANNYLILLETTRVGARYGTVQTGDTSPISWNNNASISPNLPTAPTDPTLKLYRSCPDINRDARVQGFYNILSCVMLQSMTPLEFHSQAFTGDANYQPPADGSPQVDDIVISVFSLQLVDPNAVPATLQGALANEGSVPGGLPEVLVVGRYPTNANECYVNGTNIEPRDPFDYLHDTPTSKRNFSYVTGTDPSVEINRNYLELPGYDSGSEIQRGFSWAGRHVISTSSNQCYGSEWSMAQVQRLVNLPDFSLLNTAQRGRLASQGLVLVEMFWRHYLLLKNPVFNPVFTLLGPQTIISVWSAFPVPAVEPRIKFPTTPPAYSLGGS